ncbi:DUF1016 N-terminal domain-containing protein [Sphingobacterium faecale]|uniref:YhcG N-terminal domain-containing protein n=1 Tax=Sphingobacterium faecale TaxID=2803775 RepID=A0ABS1R0L2_9SPHI|nr:DUF1016 N-terminal domain-containing protein [Sphingobacterium faecale]MBL1408213.1 hypothetical protein [Sphingobacterium faecale]
MESIVSDIINIIENGRQKAYHVINISMVESYWLIGQRIVEDEQQGKSKAGYGDSLLKILSKGLSKKFGSGFSPANLRNFRQFYLTYPDIQKCYALRSKLSWTHHRTIMRVENERAREYYIREAEEQNWSTRSLERNINSLYYERLLSSKDKKIGLQSSIEQEKNLLREQGVMYGKED